MGADAAAYRRGEGAFDGHEVVLDGRERVAGKPLAGAVVGLLPGEDLKPDDLAAAAVGFLHGTVEHVLGGTPDVRPGAVPFDERDDRMVGHVELAALQRDEVALGRGRQVLVGGHGRRQWLGLRKGRQRNIDEYKKSPAKA